MRPAALCSPAGAAASRPPECSLRPAVGGNHEASNHLWELYYGGWAAPRIYYLGHAGVVTFGGIRIGGLSGIFNAGHYRKARRSSVTDASPAGLLRGSSRGAVCRKFAQGAPDSLGRSYVQEER